MSSSISSLGCLVACASGLLSSGTEAAAQFALEHANYWVREDEGTVQVVVRRGGSLESPATVGYATTNGTAKAGDDYVAASGTLAFAAGETFKTLLVAIPNNGVRNSNRTFTLGLNQVSPDAGLSSPRIASIAVLDNDPGIEFASPRLWVHESEGSVTLTVIRGNDARLQAFAVDYETVDGTALAGRDYVASRGTLNFGVGETRRSFPVPVLGTASPAKDRQFRVSLLRPSEGFALGSSTTAVATVTICDSREMLAHRWVASRPTNDGAISLALVGGHTAGLGSSNRFVGDFDIVPVEVSTNLADWSSRAWLTRAPGGTNATVWTDAEGGSGPIRFYRTPATTFPAPQRPPSGPYPVGFTDRILADDTRRNRFRVSTNTTFPVTVWYPARRPAGAWPSEPYHPAEFARDPRPGAWEGDVDRAPYWKRYALRDVPVADGLSRLPVVVWSSGYLYA
ncbi:MAG: hypothetical protein JNL97_06445, partial [Verrucomicrobiales bacterium]|nr:hypothetical protein [Verrucomicrobiales bacterium]